MTITISVGIATLLPAEDAASLMARADAAMYEAKRAGGNRVCQSAPLKGDAPESIESR